VGDFDAVQAAFGTFIACGVKTLHFFSADSALELYLEGCKSTYKKMPEDKKILYFWYIEDLDRSNKFMGQVTVSTYTDPVPDAYADTHLLSLSLVVAKKYRNKGITSRIAMAVYKYLSTLEPLQNGTFCFDTRTDNIVMHKIATKLGAQLIDTRDKVIDFEIIDSPDFPAYTIPSDLFIIPRQ
jgi:RimJ/RimL family protein N-acetyltransferase